MPKPSYASSNVRMMNCLPPLRSSRRVAGISISRRQKSRSATRPARSGKASMCAAKAAMCWRHRASTRAAGATPGRSTVRTSLRRHRHGCWTSSRSARHAEAKPPAIQPTEWRSLMVDGVDEGQRDTAATRLCGYLLHHRVDPIVALEILQLWNSARCRPPLPQKDIERIAASIAGKEIRRRYGRGGR